MPKSRKRQKLQRRFQQAQREAVSTKPTISLSCGSLPIVRLPFLNLAELSRAEIQTARHTPNLQCASCDRKTSLRMACSWRNASGIAYIAAFCSFCIMQAGTSAQLEPFEVEMKIDLALFEAAEQTEIALVGSEARR